MQCSRLKGEKMRVKIGGRKKHYKTIWWNSAIKMIDQNALPSEFKVVQSKSLNETCKCIKNMTVRGAGAIGAAAGYAMAQGVKEAKEDANREEAKEAAKEAKEAFVHYTKAIAFDGVNLVADLGLIAASKGKYRKAFMIKAGVDAGLLVKDAFLYWYTGKTIRDLFLSIQKGSPYENWNALFETGKYILFNKIFPCGFIYHKNQVKGFS